MKHRAGTTFIVSVVSVLTISLGATPALASPFDISSTGNEAVASLDPQLLNTGDADLTSTQLDSMLEVVEIGSGPDHSFDVDAAIAAAESEIGTSRATGWGMAGECIISAKRWVHAGNGGWTGSGSPVANYVGATRLPMEYAEAGDIIQYEYIQSPHAWASGVHTVLVTGVNEDGTLSIIESNNPFGSGLVTTKDNWTPEPPPGFQPALWRF